MAGVLAQRVVVVGAGYVGYPLAVLAASAGHEVVAVDTSVDVVEAINAGRPRSNEPTIVGLAASAAAEGRLSASTEAPHADVFVIAVPTPLEADGRTPDMSIVERAARRIAPVLEPGAMVIVESTVAPGACRDLVAPLLEAGGLTVGDDIRLAHCPERVLPGRTIDELVHGERVIGGIDDSSTAAAAAFYATFSRGELVETDLETAEFVKVMENTYRDVNIALANQISELARAHGVDPHEAIRIANSHPRVRYLSPGIGVGGHCLPVDPWFLVPRDPAAASLVTEARRVNDAQPSIAAERILGLLDTPNPRIVLFGVSYKPNVPDTRNSPALAIRAHLEGSGATVVVHDPVADGFGGDVVEACTDADLAVVLVPHESMIRELLRRRPAVLEAMRAPQIVDVSSGSVVPWPPDALPPDV